MPELRQPHYKTFTPRRLGIPPRDRHPAMPLPGVRSDQHRTQCIRYRYGRCYHNWNGVWNQTECNIENNQQSIRWLQGNKGSLSSAQMHVCSTSFSAIWSSRERITPKRHSGRDSARGPPSFGAHPLPFAPPLHRWNHAISADHDTM
jgi:hypothetical protein